jgi:ankyrin repeat protein
MIGNLEIVKLLVKKGADVNARDDASIGIDGKYYNGMTPLGMALEYRNIQPYNNIANFLEQHGARE